MFKKIPRQTIKIDYVTKEFFDYCYEIKFITLKNNCPRRSIL